MRCIIFVCNNGEEVATAAAVAAVVVAVILVVAVVLTETGIFFLVCDRAGCAFSRTDS